MALYYMPDDFADLATAIAAMVGGADTLIVRDGVWQGANNRGISPGKDVVVRSENDWQTCIFDAQGLNRHLSFTSGETTACVFDGFSFINGSQANGGSIYVTNGTPKFMNCVFTGNAATSGGVCYANGGGADPQFWNCLMYGNTATNKGGAIYAYNGGCNPNLVSCTITANHADGNGGGIAGDGWGGSYIYNTILWGNTASSAPNFYLGLSPVGRAHNSCYDLVGMIGNFISNTACVFTDPLLVAGSLGNYYLSHIAAGEGADSPCIDIGNVAYTDASWNTLTTRSDNVLDVTPPDIGFHWPPVSSGDPGADMMMQLTS